MRIKELREQRGILQKEMGDALGIAQNTLSQYETGRREPDLETTKRIADYFGVTVDELLGIVGQKETPAPIEEDELKLKIAAFWGGGDDLSKKELDELWSDAESYYKFKLSKMREKGGSKT